MQARTRTALVPVVLLGLLAAAVGGSWLWDRRSEAARARREEDARVLRFAAAEVEGLTVVARGETVRVERGAGGWRLVAPYAAPADGAAVNALLEALAGLRRRAALDASGDLARFGLAAPRVQLTLALAGGRSLALALGDPLALDGTAYARAGAGPVEVLTRDPGAALAKGPLDLRERRVLGPGAEPARIEVAGPGTGYALEKVGGRWRLTAPVSEPADPGAAALAATALTALTATGFETAARSDAVHGLDRPLLDVRVTLAGGVTRLEFGAPPGAAAEGAPSGEDGEHAPPSLWVRRDADPELLAVPAAAVEPLRRPAEALRDHTVLAFDAGRVARVRLAFGADVVALERHPGAGWTMTAPRAGPARSEPLDGMLATLGNLRATAIAGDGDAVARERGLAPPARSVELLAADGAAVARLELGRVEGDAVAVRPGGSARVFLVPKAVAEAIPASAAALAAPGAK